MKISEFKINAVIFADRFGDSLSDVIQRGPLYGYDVTAGILELNLFESITSPFINGTIVIGDTQGLFSEINFQGTEYIKLELVSDDPNIETQISKTMIIREVSNTTKSNDYTEIKQFELIEPFAFYSRCYPVSRYYKGPPINIIRKILSDQPLNKVIDEKYNEPPIQTQMQITTPWWEPLKTVEWIRDRCTNVNGHPYMIFSTIFQNNIIVDNLENMLVDSTRQIIEKPFVYSTVSDDYGLNSLFMIAKLKNENSDNTLDLVRNGAAGSFFGSFDLTRGREVYGEKHDITKTIFSALNSGNLDLIRPGALTNLEGNVSRSQILDKKFIINGEYLKDIPSKRYYQTAPTGSFEGVSGYRDEAINDDLYKSMIQNKALRNALRKNEMTMTLNGLPFFAAKASVGTRINIDTRSGTGGDDSSSTMSGKYLISSMRHIFSGEKYIVTAKVTRLESVE